MCSRQLAVGQPLYCVLWQSHAGNKMRCVKSLAGHKPQNMIGQLCSGCCTSVCSLEPHFNHVREISLKMFFLFCLNCTDISHMFFTARKGTYMFRTPGNNRTARKICAGAGAWIDSHFPAALHCLDQQPARSEEKNNLLQLNKRKLFTQQDVIITTTDHFK